LHSQKNFYEIYGKDLSKRSTKEGFVVIIFAVENLEGINENVGHTAASQVVQSLGAYVNKHFGAIGISTRIERDRIATILSGIDAKHAEQLLEDFARDLRERGLADIQADTQMGMPSDECFSFSIFAGLVDGRTGDDIEIISKKAAMNEKIIATFTCEMGR